MNGPGNRHSIPVLYADAESLASHRVRLVAAEKSLDVDLVEVVPGNLPADLLEVSPDGDVPALVDRDLALYDPRVIVDYIDERYPHPAFMPVDPISRARVRLALFRVQRDWTQEAVRIERAMRAPLEAVDQDQLDRSRRTLMQSLIGSNEVFAAMPFFLSDEYSLLDAFIAPLLWRLPRYGIVLPREAAAVLDYGQRVFRRDGFERSLTRQEREMRA